MSSSTSAPKGAYYEVSGFGRGSLPEAAGKFARDVKGVCEKEVLGEGTSKGSFDVEMWKPLAVVLIQVAFLRWSSTDGGMSVAGEDPSLFSLCSVFYPLAGTVLYLSMIFFGTRWMQGRAPLQIQSYMFAYNLYQMVINAWCFASFILEMRRLGMSVWGNPVDKSPRAWQLSFLIYVHYNNKFIELLDTAFMILRKKTDQVTFLHVYHHCLLLWSWFLVCRFACGGDAYFGAAVNSGIHVLMYAYYLVRTLGVAFPFKHLLTQLQLAQFGVCSVHGVYSIAAGTYPSWLCLIYLFVMINMLILFRNFYRASYRRSNPPTTTSTGRAASPCAAAGSTAAASSSASSASTPRRHGAPSFTWREIRRHNAHDDCWLVVHGRVYDVTEFSRRHPGGDIILLGGGTDATPMYESYHPGGVHATVLAKHEIGTVARVRGDNGDQFYSWSSSFYRVLKERVVRRIRERGHATRRGGLLGKTALIMTAWCVSYYLMAVRGWVLGGAAWGVACAHIGLSIMHDGNHGAFSPVPWVNKLAGWGMDLIGSSGYTWEFQHVVGHHQYTNLESASRDNPQNDPDAFSSFPLLRMHPSDPHHWYHAYQHLYALPLFAFNTMAKVFWSDLELILKGQVAQISMRPRLSDRRAHIRFWASKLLNLVLTVLVPVYLHGLGHGLLLPFVAHAVCGEYLAVCFIVNHISEACSFLYQGRQGQAQGQGFGTPDKQQQQQQQQQQQLVITGPSSGKCGKQRPLTGVTGGSSPPRQDDWAALQCQSSVNWNVGSWFWNVFSGGLNHQVEHHLFPSIAHHHYPYIADVVRSTCHEFQVPYMETSFRDAFCMMLRHLRDLGQVPGDGVTAPAASDTLQQQQQQAGKWLVFAMPLCDSPYVARDIAASSAQSE